MHLPDTVSAFADTLMHEADGGTVSIDHELRLDVSGCIIDVATNDRPLHEKLVRYFAELIVAPGDGVDASPDFRIVCIEGPTLELDVAWTVKEPEPGKTRIKEEWVDLADGRVVRKRLTGMVFAFGGSLHLGYGPCRDNDNQVINFVNNRYMQWRLAQGFVLAHAGAVARDGRCLAMCGPSGSGKSTAALGLVGDGLDFVSNDRLLLRATSEGVEVHGIPKHPRVNPGTILFNPLLEGMIPPEERRQLLALPGDELRELEQKYDVLIDELVGPDRFRMRGELDALIVFNYGGDEDPSWREIDIAERPELLPLITKSPGLFYEAEPGQPEPDLSDQNYVDTFSRARVVEITGRQDFAAARRLCLEVLDSGGATIA